ncbi:DUF4393 domain-containing protein [Oscillibacter sp.]|uniref:DUF4393 domain-containing protein n=2 Tax=unclassified Oscillibacter TaxID=2629304 RepID=UPI00289CA6A6|nr:DUF4393 domain-containing protein [Oscillibacter sp.]
MNGSAIVDGASAVLNAVPEVYNDLAKPAACETGKFLGRIPRAINAALIPLDLWITKREYELEKTKKLLEIELADVDPSKIVSPESYVAVPALQSIAYSMDSEELRTMYAKLLAKSMNTDYRESVHPSFVEIIKQLSPLDAQNLNYITTDESPIAEYRLCLAAGDTKDALNISVRQLEAESEYFNSLSDGRYELIMTNVFLENPDEKDLEVQAMSISSLQRLGLIRVHYSEYANGADYAPFFQTQEYIYFKKSLREKGRLKICVGVTMLTPLGSQFCKICQS